MSKIQKTVMDSMGPILGVVIGVVVLTILASLTILSGNTSTGIASGIQQFNDFLPLIGVLAAVGVALAALRIFGGGRGQ